MSEIRCLAQTLAHAVLFVVAFQETDMRVDKLVENVRGEVFHFR